MQVGLTQMMVARMFQVPAQAQVVHMLIEFAEVQYAYKKRQRAEEAALLAVEEAVLAVEEAALLHTLLEPRLEYASVGSSITSTICRPWQIRLMASSELTVQGVDGSMMYSSTFAVSALPVQVRPTRFASRLPLPLPLPSPSPLPL